MQMRVAMGTWLSLAGAVLGCGGESEPPSRPDIFLFTVESLRPDHVGCYTGVRDTTPNLDALARESVVYADAHSVTSWTLASHASMFTGLYPTAHGTTGARSKLHDQATTLADLLAANGYQTAGAASGPYLARGHNLNQGFEYYDDSAATVGTQGGAHDDITNPTLEKVIGRFLNSYRDAERPLFFFAYYWDPHYDYIPPAPFDELYVEETHEKISMRGFESSHVVTKEIRPAELDYVLSQYDGEIRYTDHYLGRLFDELKEAGLWQDSVIIVTSDHGEEFFDHGEKGHKHSLYAESVHVPLIVKYPRSARTGRDDRLVSLVDLFPTILELAGVEGVPAHQGKSLLDPDPDPDRSIFFELLSTFYHRLADRPGFRREDEEWLAVRRRDRKLISVPSQSRRELYRMESDRMEQLDIATEEPEQVADLQRLLDAWRAESMAIGESMSRAEADLDPEQIERLRELGYLDRPESKPSPRSTNDASD
jgi:arylsulfatase A-like enzyme